MQKGIAPRKLALRKVLAARKLAPQEGMADQKLAASMGIPSPNFGSELLPLLASSMHIRVVLSKVLQIILSH